MTVQEVPRLCVWALGKGGKAGTALAHGGLPVAEALADELVHARLSPDATDLHRRVYAAPGAAGRPPYAPCGAKAFRLGFPLQGFNAAFAEHSLW
jgi:hypothetical protein